MKRRARALPFIIAALVAAAVGLVCLETDALDGVEHTAVDARFDVRGEQQPRSDVVIVSIDDKTLNADPKGAYPFNRRRHARVIRQLTQAGASVIAFDIQFTQPSADEGADNALVEAVRAGAPRVVLATTAVDPGAETLIFGGGEALEYSRATPAFTGVVRDADGVVRRMPPSSENGLENIALATARLRLGRSRSVSRLAPGSTSLGRPAPSRS